jgi:hypothetical protein
MWIFLNDAYLSIVEHRDDPDRLIVRARVAGDIERVFPAVGNAEVDPRADYRYRVTLRRSEVADAIRAAVISIDYPNFKDSVESHERHRAYAGVWSEMTALQPEGGRYHHPAPRNQQQPSWEAD